MHALPEPLAPLARHIEDVVGAGSLRERFASGRPLRIKYGVDCTAPDLHLGHAVNLWMMRHLQDLGHTVVFLLGDATTAIGDPSGRSATRPRLAPEEIDRNAAAFLEQASLVLDTDPGRLEIRRNSAWWSTMPATEFITLLSMTTHAQLVGRDMFRDRLASDAEIATHELVYPVLQGYDSVMTESDLTIVGSDQLYNEMMGRHFQHRFGQEPQAVITSRITPGLDGGPKQSKSLGNYVSLTDPAPEKFGKLMSLRDDLVGVWAAAYTDLTDAEAAGLGEQAASGGVAARDAKLALAEEVVARYHGAEAAARARAGFLARFSEGRVPEDVAELTVPARLTVRELLALARPELSVSAGRRLLVQGAVRLDGTPLREDAAGLAVGDGAVLRTGPRHLVRLRTEPAAPPR
ncbi:tyrosine--tRNA ligase [Streptomyces sp. NPDC059785]|uniref:tyrosine--tRNA ligase n=1 Tax=unclassified Streptomyces TaxID=2593676 RepID=UPI00365520CA